MGKFLIFVLKSLQVVGTLLGIILGILLIAFTLSSIQGMNQEPYKEFCLEKGFDNFNYDYPYVDCIKQDNETLIIQTYYCNIDKDCFEIKNWNGSTQRMIR